MTRIAYTPGMTLDEPLVNAEVYGANPQRVSNQAGGSPTDIQLLNVDLGVEARHVVIHDVHNVGWWANAPGIAKDRTLYNVTVYNVGWRGLADKDRPDGGHGQALYTQNYASGGQRTIDTCVFIAGFSLPGKIYGTNSEIAGTAIGYVPQGDGTCHAKPMFYSDKPGPYSYLSLRNKLANYTIRRAIFVGPRFIVGNEGKSIFGAHNIRIDDCVFACGMHMGYQGDNGDGSITDSLFTHGLSVQTDVQPGTETVNLHEDGTPITERRSWANLTFTGNVVHIPHGATVNVVYPGANWRWDYNEYWSEVERPFVVTLFKGFDWLPSSVPGMQMYKTPRLVVEQRALTFEEWRDLTGFDAHSHYNVGPGMVEQRTYSIPEKGEKVVVRLSAESGAPEGATVLYPPPPLLNWEGEPLPVTGNLHIWREPIAVDPEPDCTECEAALALALADAEALRAELVVAQRTIADREQRIREDADVIRSLQAQVVELQSEGARDKQIADAWRVLMGVNHA